MFIRKALHEKKEHKQLRPPFSARRPVDAMLFLLVHAFFAAGAGVPGITDDTAVACAACACATIEFQSVASPARISASVLPCSPCARDETRFSATGSSVEMMPRSLRI